MSDDAPSPSRILVPAGIATVVVLGLILLDDAGHWEWLLARLLGVALAGLGYGAFAYCKRQPWWSEFFTFGLAGEVLVRVVEPTPLAYLPPVWVALKAASIVLPLAFAGGIREAIKDRTDLTPTQSMLLAFGAGAFVHHVVVGSLVAGLLTLLGGKYG